MKFAVHYYDKYHGEKRKKVVEAETPDLARQKVYKNYKNNVIIKKVKQLETK